MDSRSDDVGQDGVLSEEVMESLGEPHESSDESSESHEKAGSEHSNDTLRVQKRLKAQKRAHEREMREMHARMADMQSRLSQGNSEPTHGMNYAPQQGSVEELIHKAVSGALQHRENEERKAKEAENQAKVQRQYQDLHNHLDSMGDKYEDYDEVVRGPDAQYTPHMRDAALFLPKKGAGSAGEVLYHLGKNPDELSRISKLHGLEQASEMVKLSHFLNSGGESKGSQSVRPLGAIKNNPVTNSHIITEKTSPAEIRARMKAGKFR